MRRAKNFLYIFSLSLFLAFSVNASTETENLAVQAVSTDANESKIAVGKLREMKQAGLDALFQKYALEINEYKTNGKKGAEWSRIASAIDEVAMQKDAYASQLFWLTDLEQAKKLSKETGKPILSLRLLGNLNEEFSCANSRFFRAVLYPNKEVSEYLRANYILHWQSVRPAPRITVDFGDGRKIERTVTGNSIHYVLDENGEVVNALPGLNSPKDFYSFVLGSLMWLTEAKDFEAGKFPVPNGEKVTEKRRTYLKNMRSRLFAGLRESVNEKAFPLKINFDKKALAKREFEEMPTAIEVAPVAVTKMFIENKFLPDILPDITRYGAQQIDFETWQRIASSKIENSKLDANSRAFIKNQLGKTASDEKQFNALITKLESLIAVDTVRNDFLLRPTLLVWLNKDMDKNVAALNKKVYDELFLTPNEDKWLGLYAPDVYTGLDGNGLIY